MGLEARRQPATSKICTKHVVLEGMQVHPGVIMYVGNCTRRSNYAARCLLISSN